MGIRFHKYGSSTTKNSKNELLRLIQLLKEAYTLFPVTTAKKEMPHTQKSLSITFTNNLTVLL